MIEHLPQNEQAWLERFFTKPNDLSWLCLLDGSAPSREAQQVREWLSLLGSHPTAPLILPFMRGGSVTGWYATTQGASGGFELGDEINAWLGPTWLTRFERVTEDWNDPMATELRNRFGGIVYRFTGADEASMQTISARLSEFAAVLERRPPQTLKRVRPIGAIRSDFERSLLAGDEFRAEAMIAEFKQTGRLNEENLRYLEVRLSAGLGLWPQIARDHWLIKTLADLALPPQILTDLIEALYRTHVDDLELIGDATAMRDAFAQHVAIPYPKLFSSRRGIRAPRVVKAFALYEQIQANPDPSIIESLLRLLPEVTDTDLFKIIQAPQSAPVTTTLEQADDAFDDGQFDRAFEFYLRLPASRKTISRLVTCVATIGTDEARDHLLAVVGDASEELVASLAPAVVAKLDSLRQAQAALVPPHPDTGSGPSKKNAWMRWAEQLQAERDLVDAEREVQSAPTNWDVAEIRDSGLLAQEFSEIIGGLNGAPGAVARAAVPQIFASFFPDDVKVSPTARPVASLLFLLIAMDEMLSRTDLELLGQLTSLLIEQGVSSGAYVSLINDLEDVQKRIGSYSYLPWSLDVCEALATLPCPSDAARDARLRLFMQVLDQAAGFAHRLASVDLVPIEALAKDYGIGADALITLKRDAQLEEGNAAAPQYDLDGKTIGIYTLAETAGNRAKSSLEALFPGCKVVLNSDKVATAQLKSLARAADLFVFAWKSSSHQAFYCVKDALAGRDPIWAPGKGTASILRAVLDYLD